MTGLSIHLNFRSDDPIYVQIMDQIRHKIATGALKPGDQLPTVRQLAADLRVNFNTIARAYRMLDEARIISTQQGRGTYILEPESVEDEERLRAEDLERLTHRYLSEARQLGFSPEEVWATFEEILVIWKEKTTTSISEED